VALVANATGLDHIATALEKWWQKNATTKFLGKYHVDHLKSIFPTKSKIFGALRLKSPTLVYIYTKLCALWCAFSLNNILLMQMNYK